jgi:hypothetical protein
MPDAPQWDGKIHRPAKAGKGFRWDTAGGAPRRVQSRERHQRYTTAQDEAELEAAEWANRPWRVKVTVTIVECLLWPFKVIGRFTG